MRADAVVASMHKGVDSAKAAKFERRRADWRVGHVLYQVFVDRFAPSRRLESKREHYAPPRTLRSWDQEPERTCYLQDELISDAEVQFWGGDLDSFRSRLDYVQSLGVEVVYFNPIFHAFSNHKYDAIDYRRVDPQYGTNEELKEVADDLHARGMRLMLDGVFNHMGRRSPLFQEALKENAPREESWFYIGNGYRHGFRGWRNVANLPELNLENPQVREMLYEAPDSVVQSYLRDCGIDGWRLDVAPDVGYEYLGALTEAAHRACGHSVVIGECWNYPEEWLKVLDGIMNMHARLLLLNLVDGKMTPRGVGRAIERMVQDCDYEGLLRSHMVVDNHDVPRLPTLVPDYELRSIVRALQFTLPGCPVIYYGSELGMAGGHDPTNRGPMKWELATEENEELKLTQLLTRARTELPALRVGDFRLLDSENCLAFTRYTERAMDTVLVLVNPSDREVHDVMAVRNSRLMDVAPMECILTRDRVSMHCGVAEVKLPPKSVRIFKALDFDATGGYSLYKRVP